MNGLPFIQMLPDLLLDREILEQELPHLPDTQQETMVRHLEGLNNSISFIERLGT